jgi:FixJ family two-component response regulator
LILKGQGFIVDAYTDPVKALSEFKPNYYGLVILDYRMPSLNGLDLYRRIRRVDNMARGILLTASHEQLYLGENKQGLLTILRKPVPTTELLDEVALALNQNSEDLDSACMNITLKF